jgi:hypothetical protein
VEYPYLAVHNNAILDEVNKYLYLGTLTRCGGWTIPTVSRNMILDGGYARSS